MPDEEHHTSAMVTAVRDMAVKLEQHTRNGDEARSQLQQTVEAVVAALRQDVHKAITSLQLNQVDHKSSHEADRIERATRQQTVDTQMGQRQQAVDVQLAQIRNWLIGGLVGIVAIGAFLIGWLVF